MVWAIVRNLQLGRLGCRGRRIVVFFALALGVLAAMSAAFALRFDFSIPRPELRHLLIGLLVALPVKLVIFQLTQQHRGWWTSFGLIDLSHLISINVVASVTSGLGIFAAVGSAFPRSIYVLDFVLTVGFISLERTLLRLYREHPSRRGKQLNGDRKPVLIYGAGWAGSGLYRELWSHPELGYQVVGFLDDGSDKQGESVSGARVLGAGHEAPDVINSLRRRNIDVQEILIAMPSASGKQMREAIANCNAAGVSCKTLPGVGDLLSDKRLAAQMREISVEDLLGREQIELDEAAIRKSLAQRSVMVTGAAGSIGSELSRQIATFQPKILILVDRSESDLFRIDMEIRSHFPDLNLVAEIADIGDYRHIDDLMRVYQVECVYHAAAYKHVPLMELHPLEAASNNIIGTWNTAQAAAANGVKWFVNISSDKAVNPTNIMGATKRVSELIVSSFPYAENCTRFMSVRFGNVLASNGSVVPIFESQIAAGGPVTVTHPEVRRYFMTAREAVQLVLQSSTMGQGSEVYVLDMGEPVRIADLARKMVRLAGLVPDEDIEIRYVGLRPGEKLFEELITEGEHVVLTHHQKIKIFKGPPVSAQQISRWIGELNMLLSEGDQTGVVAHLARLVPEYQISPQWQEAVDKNRVKALAAGAAGAASYFHSSATPIPSWEQQHSLGMYNPSTSAPLS